MMLVAAQSFAGWSITNPDDDQKYADESNIVAEGTGGGPVQTYLVKLKRPDGTTAQEFGGATSPNSPYAWQKTFTPPGGGWRPLGTGWHVDLWAN